MASPSICPPDKGFTLVEIVIVIAILAVIFSLGMFISFDVYKSYSFRSEKSVILSVLQKARSRALANVNQTRHGVRFESSPARYIIFECPLASSQCSNYTASSSDIIVDAARQISFIPPSPNLPFTIIFEQLSGDCVNCLNPETVIAVSDGVRSYTVTINSEGMISW
jgi:prepilin-type N-terminal cleavage/methylation domain-containing protein